MSSNLLKRGFTQLVEEDARVIDTNDLVAKRIRELAAKMQQDEGTGFISGLAADKVEALDRKSTRLNSSHVKRSRMPSSA